MKSILIILGMIFLWRFFSAKVFLMYRLQQFDKTKKVSVLGKSFVSKAQTALDGMRDDRELRKYILEAGSVIHASWEKGFANCSVNELECVMFYQAFLGLACPEQNKNALYP